jgi:hypothetical protein
MRLVVRISTAAECRKCSCDPHRFERADNFTLKIEGGGVFASVGW